MNPDSPLCCQMLQPDYYCRVGIMYGSVNIFGAYLLPKNVEFDMNIYNKQ